MTRRRNRVVAGHYIGGTAPLSRAPGGMFVDPAQAPADLMEPSMEPGQPSRVLHSGAVSFLVAVADALNACERAGLKPKLRHGGIIETGRGYVVRAGRAWVARTAEWTESGPATEGIDDD